MDADEAFLIYSKEVLLINLCLDLAKMVDTATYIALKDTMAEERTNKRRKKNLCEFCLESRSVLSSWDWLMDQHGSLQQGLKDLRSTTSEDQIHCL
jgi:hypothetical protein